MNQAHKLYNDRRRIALGNLQKNLYGVVHHVETTGERKFITRAGKVVAIIASLEEMSRFDLMAEPVRITDQLTTIKE